MVPTRDLDPIADDTGRFAILAMDQRGTLRSMLESAGVPSSDTDMGAFKVDVVAALSAGASGVLLDVEYGVRACRAARVLPPDVGLLLASERSPGPKWQGEYRTEYVPERGPAFVTAEGGSALKFLLRWRPDRPHRPGEPDLAGEALDAVRSAVAACRAWGMPCVVEPVIAPLPGEVALSTEQKRRLVVRSATLLTALGPDLLKLEWPGEEAGCAELTEVCGSVPWALLSGGVDHARFVERVMRAMDAGASGFIAGRAIWAEAIGMATEARQAFLRTTAAERLAELRAAARGRGRSWRSVAMAA